MAQNIPVSGLPEGTTVAAIRPVKKGDVVMTGVVRTGGNGDEGILLARVLYDVFSAANLTIPEIILGCSSGYEFADTGEDREHGRHSGFRNGVVAVKTKPTELETTIYIKNVVQAERVKELLKLLRDNKIEYKIVDDSAPAAENEVCPTSA